MSFSASQIFIFLFFIREADIILMIYGGEFSINKLYSLVTPPHQAACGVLVKVILMIYGGEFSINKLYSLVTPPRQVAYAP